MGFGFRKRIKIAPGISLNVSKSGVSTSIGGKGFTYNTRGRTTVSVPGTGLRYTTSTRRQSAHGGDAPTVSNREQAKADLAVQLISQRALAVVDSCASFGAYVTLDDAEAGWKFLRDEGHITDPLDKAWKEIDIALRIYSDSGSFTSANKERALRALYEIEEGLAAARGDIEGLCDAVDALDRAQATYPQRGWGRKAFWCGLAAFFFSPFLAAFVGRDHPNLAVPIPIIATVAAVYFVRRAHLRNVRAADERVAVAHAELERLVRHKVSFFG
ncbi:DUF4236 domain-containing protein [Burkholderia ubonensis]|uniref:DUF4236 domain-containing protein n=1 Tax=Burkholderia ubonensis TaxID=101571 RepID=UPI0009B34E42|nr:DUF4236 domain-containing protein [Burkholderia ubonensis]